MVETYRIVNFVENGTGSTYSMYGVYLTVSRYMQYNTYINCSIYTG